MKSIDVVGKQFGRLTVLSVDRIRQPAGTSRQVAECLCSCGTVTRVLKDKLLSGRQKSCGCWLRENQKKLGSYHKKAYTESSFNAVLRSYRVTAAKRGYDFSLTEDYFRKIIVKPCIYCGSELQNTHRSKGQYGSFSYTGIDRMDNTLGYTVENSVPCCRVCNRIKRDLDVTQLSNHLKKMLSNENIWRRTA